MKTELTSTFFCLSYGHNYFHLKETKSDTPELVCKSCKKYFKYNTHGDIVEEKPKQRKLILIKNKTAI